MKKWLIIIISMTICVNLFGACSKKDAPQDAKTDVQTTALTQSAVPSPKETEEATEAVRELPKEASKEASKEVSEEVPKEVSKEVPNEEMKSKYKKISAEEAHKMIEDREGEILLDVRTEEEFREARIEGAMLIPDIEISAKAEAELPNKDALILVYCRSGRRSALAANDLIAMGYTQIYDFGGIIDWPYSTVSG